MSRVTVRVDDPDLAEVLEDVENQSAAVREGLRLWARQNDLIAEESLNDHQRKAYTWLVERSDGGEKPVRLKPTLTVLAQVLSLDKELVKHEVLQPLRSKNYINVVPSMSCVRVYVAPPSRDNNPGSTFNHQ